MRVVVGIPAYHRPASLVGVIMALDATASGKHPITYRVGVDRDDEETLAALGLIPFYTDIETVVAPAAPTLGEKSNTLFAGAEADAYCWLGDDVFPLTQHWDDIIARVFAQEPIHVFAWTEVNQPGMPTYPVFSRAFFNACGGKLFPEWFPYWFIDNWWAEVYRFIFGTGFPVVANLMLGGARGISNGVREPAFWAQFFIEKRLERRMQAKEIARRLGVTDHADETFPDMARWDAQVLAEYAQIAENPLAPPERYLIAKERALHGHL